MTNYAVILAGGVGSRFWPLSRNTEPKQFLNVSSKRPMLEETINRISPLIPKKNIYIAANILHKQKIRCCGENCGISVKNILFEPEIKNTFPPIAILSYKIKKIDSDAVISVLPCDHIISDNEKFRGFLEAANKAALNGNIITFGVMPKRPETGYGYIKVKGRRLAKGEKEAANKAIFKVEKFIEKPDLAAAKKFIKDKRYYWNSGVYIFQAKVLLNEIQSIMPKIYQKLLTQNDFKSTWDSMPCLSIDYAIMEKTNRIVLLPADYGWIDIGGWQAIWEALKKDKNGNIFKGKTIDIESQNTIVWSENRLVATAGLKDLIIVDTQDALLVCSKEKSQDVKKIVGLLKKSNFKKLL